MARHSIARMAETTSTRSLTETGVRLIGVYLCATSLVAIVQNLYVAIFHAPFFRTLFDTAFSSGITFFVGAFLAFCGGMIAEMIGGEAKREAVP